jgi:hypothetical protein
MEESVWSFKHVTLRHRHYLLLLVRWNDFEEPVSVELERNAKKFGEFMEGNGALIMPYREKLQQAFTEIMDKHWPDEVHQRMDSTQFPFLVVINKDFESFDPGRDPSAIIWFEDFEEKPAEVWKVLATVAKRIQKGNDVFAYLGDVQRRAQRSQLGKRAENAAKYVDINIPIIPGFVSVKAAAIWADAMKLLQ